MLNLIKSIRKAQGVRLKQLAQATGISYAGLCNIENGARNPSVGAMDIIAKALNSTVPQIFYPEII